jgi:hypothetical protein
MLLAALLGALAAPAGAEAAPRLVLGATEDIVRQPTLVAAKAQMDLLRLGGFGAVRTSQVWAPGQASLSAEELLPLRNAVGAAELAGVDVYLSVLNFGSRTTPLTDADQLQFAEFAASLARDVPTVRTFIVGNEPNLNRYWLPQFDESGGDAAAVAYERLLERTYDALKAVDPELVVLGGAVSPRGNDNPQGIRHTHSPTTFIRDLGAAYRATGRMLPIMDGFAFHPYEDNSSIAPVDGVHPNSTTIAIADHDKLVALLGEAFDGTAQRGSTLPIVYDEFGVETVIPPAKALLYTGVEPATVKPVNAQTQGVYYRQALALAFCQPNVRALFLFHTLDERDLDRWQSGVYYADGTPKASLTPTRAALDEARRGVIARCDGTTLRPRLTIRWRGLTGATFRCDVDCTWTLRLFRLPRATAYTRTGAAIGGRAVTVRLPRVAMRPGRYRWELRALAAVNPGAPVVKRSPTLSRSPGTRRA